MDTEHPEAEINRIRLEIYEETKHLTASQRTQQSNERGQRLAAQYGFKLYMPEKRQPPHTAAGGL